MPDESSTFGLNREKLSKLWKMGDDIDQDKNDVDTEKRKAELLQDQLAESLPLDAGINHLLPDIFTEVCEKLKLFTGCTFKDLLMDPETDLLIIKTIKNLHKKQAESASSELELELASIIYYASIASALVNHDIRITKLSYKDLNQSFVELSENNWIMPNLKSLFSKASEQCVKHLNK